MKNFIAVVLSFIALSTYAQSLKLIEGSLTPLKNEKVIKTEFTYNDMTVGRKELKESEYVARKKSEYNEKDPGRGDQWEKDWVADRSKRYEPSFNELFTKYAKVTASGESKYTLIFKTLRTEPGYNIGPFIGGHASARIDAEVHIVETANPSQIIAKILVTNAPGRDAMGYDYDTGLRIQEAYAKSGKEVGKFIAKLREK